MLYTTMAGWWHNPHTCQWECRDRRGKVVTTVTDETLDAYGPEAISAWMGRQLFGAVTN